jgi:4-diphosphocytidyl-2-C-methyl-D-erythritol kinase
LRLPRTADVFAPAKVNLTLHVTGRRDDGYHLLDSLVVFAGVGDRITAEAGGAGLRVTGPQGAGVPEGPENLVARAAALFDPPVAAGLTLDKHLPTASGIGGGSADAAATLTALAELDGRPLPPAEAVLRLGADVPVCLAGRPARMRGIGGDLSPVPALPAGWLVLANPGVAVPTPEVFRRLERRDNPPMPDPLPHWRDAADLAAWLGTQRNDLEAPARAIAPVIGTVLDRLLATEGCAMARMSGSGATCFGLYAEEAAARHAAAAVAAENAGWWLAAAPILT